MKALPATLVLVLAAAGVGLPAAQDASKAETEWIHLRDTIASKLADCQRKETAPSFETFRKALEELDALVRRYRLSEPDVAVAALFFKASLLDDRLDDEARALAAYDAIIGWKNLDFYFVANALVSKASIYRKHGQIAELEAMIKSYAERPGADAQILDYLRAALRKTRLKIGVPFPDFRLPLLDGRLLSRQDVMGKVTLIVFFLSTKERSLGQLQMLSRSLAGKTKAGPDARELRLVAVSLDADRKRLVETLEENEITIRVAYEGKSWQTTLAVRCGIQSVPSDFLIGPDGKIMAVDVFGASLVALIDDALKSPSPKNADRDDEKKGGGPGP